MATSLVWLSTQHQFERFLPRDSYKTQEIKLFPSLSPCKFSHSRVFAHVQHFLCTLTIGNYLKPDPESAVWKINTSGASWGLCKHGMQEWVQRLSLWEVSISAGFIWSAPAWTTWSQEMCRWQLLGKKMIVLFHCTVFLLCCIYVCKQQEWVQELHWNDP